MSSLNQVNLVVLKCQAYSVFNFSLCCTKMFSEKQCYNINLTLELSVEIRNSWTICAHYV